MIGGRILIQFIEILTIILMYFLKFLEFMGTYFKTAEKVLLILILIEFPLGIIVVSKIGIRGGSIPRILAYTLSVYIIQTVMVLTSFGVEKSEKLFAGIALTGLLVSFLLILAIFIEMMKIYNTLIK